MRFFRSRIPHRRSPDKAPGHAAELARTLGKDYDVVACCGGDGTLNETVCGLMAIDGPQPRLGYLPAGTTNDFAASLHLPKDSVAAARVITSGIPTPIDVGQFNERYFVYVASFGAFTQTSYTVPQPLKNALGHTAYMLEAVRQLPSINRSVTLCPSPQTAKISAANTCSVLSAIPPPSAA